LPLTTVTVIPACLKSSMDLRINVSDGEVVSEPKKYRMCILCFLLTTILQLPGLKIEHIGPRTGSSMAYFCHMRKPSILMLLDGAFPPDIRVQKEAAISAQSPVWRGLKSAIPSVTSKCRNQWSALPWTSR